MRRVIISRDLSRQASATQALGCTPRLVPMAFAALVASGVGSPAVAQRWPAVPEIRPSVGVYVPTGLHNRLLERAIALGAQVALELAPGAHAVFGFAWVPTERRQTNGDRRVEMAQFDLGAEWLSHEREGRVRRVSPLVGAGVGLRAYRSRDANTPSQANVAGYGALGMEVATGPVAIRLEGRDYLTAFRGLDGSAGTSLRNDITVGLGLGVRLR